jgi:putative ABC transport system permease protein
MAILFEILRAVWQSFSANRTRFVLTLLGVVIGSSSLVLLSGLLEGGKEALLIASQEAAEDDLVQVRRANAPEKQAGRTTRSLDQGDVETLEGSRLLQDATVTSLRDTERKITYRGKRRDAVIVGARPDALAIYRLTVTKGRFLSDDDLAGRRKVAVVGQKVWTELFASAPSLDGLEVKTAGDRYGVIGVLAHKPAFGEGGPWQWDNRVMLPESTFALSFPSGEGRPHDTDRIFVRLAGVKYLAARIDQVRDITRATLLRRHYGVKNFRISGEREEDAKGELIIGIISLLILATAVISLVVGGINVMNIMLVSVSERTREIGIRRAVGAPRVHLLVQFLAEAVVTAGCGGALGVALGIGLTFGAAAVLNRVVGGWSFHITPWAPPLALGSALLVGALFGWFPAWKASRLDPVEALRFE